MSSPLNRDPLQRAIDQFHASLAPNERSIFSACKSADELLHEIKQFDAIKKAHDSGRFFERIKKFNDSLKHYLDVIGILVQSHPELAALVWGAARLILQLAGNFHEFFDKLTKTLARLAEALPWYEQLAQYLESNKCNQVSESLNSSLTKIYVDILTFFQGVVRVFAKKDTSQRSRPLVFSSLFWKPFDARFADVLDDMGYHRELLRDELNLYHYKTIHEINVKECAELKQEFQELKNSSISQMGKLEKVNRDLLTAINDMEGTKMNVLSCEERLRVPELRTFALTEEIQQKHQERIHYQIRQWLSAPPFAKELEETRKRREPGTSRWFFGHEIFRNWLYSSHKLGSQTSSKCFSSHTIWVQGNPGFGKTIIAGAIIDHLQSMKRNDSPLIYYFFRQAPVSDGVISAYRSLLAQLLHHRSEAKMFEISDKFAFAMQHSPTGQDTGTQTELLELLQLCTNAIGPHFIVLDGIDECSDSGGLTRDLLTLGCNSKMILLSRPNVRSLQDKVPQQQRIIIGNSNSDDIKLFIQNKLDDLAEREMLIDQANRSIYSVHLENGANGMFLWARLMTDYLESEALSDQDRHDTITSVTMPEGLDLMYLRIIKLICQGYAANKKLARWIILWITFGKRDLTVGELEESTRLLKDDPKAKPGRMDFEKAVVMACAGIVEKATLLVSQNHISCFRFIHNSVKEYFLHLLSADGLQEIPQDKINDVKFLLTQTPHTEVTNSCLQYMLRCMPTHPLSEALGNQPGIEVTTFDLRHTLRLRAYVTNFWNIHMLEAMKEVFNGKNSEYAILRKGIDLLQTLTMFLNDKNVVCAWVETIYILRMRREKISELLHLCAENLKQKLGMNVFGGHGIDIKQIAQDFEELASYLMLLEQHWGPSLNICPERIWTWDEIDAFTPSRFLNPSSTVVHTMNSGIPSQAGQSLSSQCLCKISESTPGFVGTLSIWTSRAFEKHQKQRQFAALLEEECLNGWVATYEIWNTGDHPRSLLSRNIHLPKDEVLLQLLQSLRTGYGSNSIWKVQFPLAISPSLNQFMILRTIYWISHDKGKNSCQIRSSILSPKLGSEAQGAWDSRSINRDPTLRVGRCAIYTYWFRFGSDDTRLFFIDRTHVAVYTIPEAGLEEPSVESLCGDLEHGFHPLKMLEVIFYPNRPVVAYRTGRTVFLWAYKQPQSRPFIFYETSTEQSSYPENISFSRGSDHFVVKEYQSGFSLVLELPEQILSVLKNSDTPEGISQKAEKISSLATCPQMSIWSFQPTNQSLVSGTHIERLSSGRIQGISTLSSGRDINMVLWRDDESGFEQQRMEVIGFPEWEGIEALKPSIGLPKPGESQITVVLGTPVQTENTFGKAGQELGPILIRRDLNSLRLLTNDGNFTGTRLGDGGALKIKREITDDEKRSGVHSSVNSGSST